MSTTGTSSEGSQAARVFRGDFDADFEVRGEGFEGERAEERGRVGVRMGWSSSLCSEPEGEDGTEKVSEGPNSRGLAPLYEKAKILTRTTDSLLGTTNLTQLTLAHRNRSALAQLKRSLTTRRYVLAETDSARRSSRLLR